MRPASIRPIRPFTWLAVIAASTGAIAFTPGVAGAWPARGADPAPAPAAINAQSPQARPGVAPSAPDRPRVGGSPPAGVAPSSAAAAPGAPAPPAPPAVPGGIAGSAASTAPPPSAPLDAAGALERARAAYEYGDIDEMVASARQVSDGQLHPTPVQRAYALRYLGIGLYLTGRAEGAETAFFELLRLRPESRLDPQTTRPDVVAFFEQVRLRYAEPIRDAARANNRKRFAWNFLPPGGQLQNGHLARAITIGGIELVSLATAAASFALLKSWQRPNHLFTDHEDAARAMRIVNWTSIGVFGAAFIYGVIDGLAHYSDPQDDSPAPSPITPTFSLTPTGLCLTF